MLYTLQEDGWYMVYLKLKSTVKYPDPGLWVDAIVIWNGRLDDSPSLDEGRSFVWGYGS
ncbi:MAG: hypothetical protein SBU_000424 [Candidatus Syntrophoarchaeum butanivorans]|uniref:Uncharacterized protein n=1 Tax=Candidatus Syntropharchaeum butanivorans TaxID=1839936 RepID=A0A1F2P568_9EURY|nr:MAG: hypothetical protein SBU_000424 [Candidatus Syntrophoarchaeum butanivorans]